jgi:hypothetical protein
MGPTACWQSSAPSDRTNDYVAASRLRVTNSGYCAPPMSSHSDATGQTVASVQATAWVTVRSESWRLPDVGNQTRRAVSFGLAATLLATLVTVIGAIPALAST